MKVSGLSNQWKTREGLLESFLMDLSAHSSPIMHERCGAVYRLIEALESMEGPDVWVGTSHSLLSFVSRDTTHELDHVPTYVSVEPFDISLAPPRCGYRIGFSLTGEDWQYTDLVDTEDAAKRIHRLLLSTNR